jgi:DMSO/TMAO reductase YedYZ molybdopterin-dependent catalytic subunit
MNHFSTWIKKPFTRRGFFGVIGLGLYHLAFKTVSWANVTYSQVKKFLIRSVEGTQHVDLKTWRLKIEGLVEKPLVLSFSEIQALPRKTQVRHFICVEGWDLITKNGKEFTSRKFSQR